MGRAFLFASAIAAAIAVYPVVIYPVLVAALARLRPRPWTRAPAEFEIAHVITVHNEAQRIRAKLENALAVRYPGGRADIVVASDGSTDATESIVGEYAARGVRWLDCPRRSKEHAQLAAVRATVASVLVFSDASTSLAADSVEALLTPFADPGIGGASGADQVADARERTGEDIFIRYEMSLRRAESLAGSLVGLSGCFFAARREVAVRFKDDVPSDLGAALICLAMGLRAVHVDGARCTYTTTAEVDREFRRKRRTALRGLRGLIAYRGALAPRRLVATWQVLSHKVLRFLSPVFLGASVLLIWVAAACGSKAAMALSIVPVILAALAALAVFWPPVRRWSLPRALGFFALSSGAVLAALVDLATGRKAVTWTPTHRH